MISSPSSFHLAFAPYKRAVSGSIHNGNNNDDDDDDDDDNDETSSTTTTMGLSVSPKDAGILLVGSLFLHRLIVVLLRWHSGRVFADKHGCKPPPRRKSGIYGLRHFYQLLEASRRKESVQFLAARYKPGMYTFVLNVLGSDVMQTIEPENLKTVLATSFKDFGLGPARQEAFHDMLGDGIFTLDGKGWEYSRALLRPQFSRGQVADTAVLDTHVQRLLGHMKKAEGTDVDLQPWFFSLTLDTATEFLFGESADSLLMGDEDQKGFAYAFNEGQQWILWKLRYRKLTRLWTPRAMKEVNKAVHAFVDRFVTMALNREKYPLPEDSSGRYIFLDAVAQQQKDPKMLRNQMLNILLAGRDTTAGLIGWTFYLLARYPSVYKRLRAELEAKFGTGKPGVWRCPTFEGMKDVSYLRYVLNEGFSFLSTSSPPALPNCGCSPAPLPRSPPQRSRRRARHRTANWRRQGRGVAGVHSGGHAGAVQCVRDAPAHRSLRIRRARVPPRAMGRGKEGGAELGISALQWGAKNLPRT